MWLTGLVRLFLADNKLTSLPDEIVNMVSLETLSLTNNKFIRLPNVIDRLKKIKYIYFKGNKIRKIKFSNNFCFDHHKSLVYIDDEVQLEQYCQILKFDNNNRELQYKIMIDNPFYDLSFLIYVVPVIIFAILVLFSK